MKMYVFNNSFIILRRKLDLLKIIKNCSIITNKNLKNIKKHLNMFTIKTNCSIINFVRKKQKGEKN